MPIYISERDANLQRAMLAKDPSVSFGAKDIRNSNVVVGSPSGGSTSTTTAPKTTVSSGSSSGISPSSVTGYDPNWFRNLPPEVQAKAQQERQRVGLPSAPTDRPLAYGEYSGGNTLPAFETLPDRVKQVIGGAEQQAFTNWYNQGYLPQQQQVMFNQLMERLMQPVEIKPPNIDEIYKNVLRSKQAAIDARKQEAMQRFEQEELPRLRANLAASGFLHSDTRFARERAARESLEKTLQAVQAEAEADALEEALQRSGLEASIAKTLADTTLRQQALALQAQANAAQQAYQQGMLGLQREQFEWGRPFDIAKLTGTIPTGLPGAGGPTLAGRGVEADIENQRLGQLLAAIGLMGKVPQAGGQFGDLLSTLGVRPGTPTAEMTIANLNRDLQRALASMTASAAGSDETGREVSTVYRAMMNQAYNEISAAKGKDRKLNEIIDSWVTRLRKEADGLLIKDWEADAGIAVLESMRPEKKEEKKKKIKTPVSPVSPYNFDYFNLVE